MKLVPKRRFKGFSGEWEESILGALASFSKGKGYSRNDLRNTGTPIILYGSLYTDYRTVITKVNTFVKGKADSHYSSGNEVIVPSSGETKEDIARASAVKKPGIILGGDLNVIRPNAGLDSIFLALSISSGTRKKQLSEKATGASVVHLYKDDLQELNLVYPTKQEQSHISAFFQSLEKAIVFQHDKLKKLKVMKQAYLHEMFPAEGESVPKRRFEGFTGEWKEQKLADIAEIVGGGTPSTSNPAYWNGNIDWYSPTEIGKQVFTNGSIKTITQLGLEKSPANLLPANRTILFTSRASIGDMAILLRPGATNQGFQSLVLRDGMDSYFIYSMGHLLKAEALKNASGSTFLEVSGNNLGKIRVLIPFKEEQQKIGSFFRKLDERIAKQEEKVKKLKAMKHAYLHEMFV